MLEKLFEGTHYVDFPSFEVALFSLLLSFVLSSVIAFTYQATYPGAHFPKNLFQAMILSSIVTSMIMMAVGSNLAVGFGIIGAVAIIRFRTLIQNPRNIIFMFAGISIGIATGVYGYAIAIAGTIIFCLVAFLLSISPYNKLDDPEYNVLVFHKNPILPDDLFNLHCDRVQLMELRKTAETMRSEFIVRFKKGATPETLFEQLGSREDLDEVRMEARNTNVRL